MKLRCPSCHEIIALEQEYPHHAGFSNRGFLYCDSCPALVKFDAFDPRYVELVGDRQPWSLNDDEKGLVEDALIDCKIGRSGRFKFGASPRCPHCNEPLNDLLTDDVHFIEVGEVLDGEKHKIWKRES